MPRHIRFRSYQSGLRNPDNVDKFKALMRAGEFVFARTDGRIVGQRDPWGVYYMDDGNHRMAAALEIERETGDPWAVHELLQHGFWNVVEVAKAGHGPMPVRGWRGWVVTFINLLGRG